MIKLHGVTLYRLHGARCSGKRPRDDREYQKCQCPIYADGKMTFASGSEKVREALKLSSMEEATKRLNAANARGWWKNDPNPPAAPVEDTRPTVVQGTAAFLREMEHGERLAPRSLKKYRTIVKRLLSFCEARQVTHMHGITTEFLRDFRDHKPMADITLQKNLQHLGKMFKFFKKSKWYNENPMEGVTGPKKVRAPQVMPFTEDEMTAIRKGIADIKLAHGYSSQSFPVTRIELEAFALTMRYTGLRIGDVTFMKEDRLVVDKEGTMRVFLYTQKSGERVFTPVPKRLQTLYGQIERRRGGHLFLGPETDDSDASIDRWRKKLKRVMAMAGIPEADRHPHRFRHTFAVDLLSKRVPIEDVSVLLAHSSIKVTQKHYSAWIKARQERLEEGVRKAWETDEGEDVAA